MIRTQVYISERTHFLLKRIAEQKKTTLSKLVREYLEKGVSVDRKLLRRSLSSLIGIIKGGPKNLSEKMWEA